jgi:hypothetical protein
LGPKQCSPVTRLYGRTPFSVRPRISFDPARRDVLETISIIQQALTEFLWHEEG